MTPKEACEELIRTCRALDRDDLTQAEWDAEWERMVRLAEQVKAGGSHLELEGLAMMSPAMTPWRKRTTIKKPPREFEPPGESVANDLIGDDPEPIGGWRRFDEKGKRIPSTALPKRTPEPPPDKPQPTTPKGKHAKGKASK